MKILGSTPYDSSSKWTLSTKVVTKNEIIPYLLLKSLYFFMDTEDSVELVDTKSGIFSVRSFYSSLASRRVDSFPHSIVWNSWAPVRVSFVAWEAT